MVQVDGNRSFTLIQLQMKLETGFSVSGRTNYSLVAFLIKGKLAKTCKEDKLLEP